MSFSCSLHRWTQTCRFLWEHIDIFHLWWKVEGWCSFASSTTCKLMLSNQNCDRSERNLKKSEKAFQQKPKDSVHRGQTSAIQLCFFLLTCFMIKLWTRVHCFWKLLRDFVSTFMLRREKREKPNLLYFSVIIDVFEYSKCFCLRVKSHIFLLFLRNWVLFHFPSRP